jgi:hypothetical protein
VLHGTNQNEFEIPHTSIIEDKNKPTHQENMTRAKNDKKEEGLSIPSSTNALSGGAIICI